MLPGRRVVIIMFIRSPALITLCKLNIVTSNTERRDAESLCCQVAGLPDRRVAVSPGRQVDGLPGCRVAGLRGRRFAGSPACRPARLPGRRVAGSVS